MRLEDAHATRPDPVTVAGDLFEPPTSERRTTLDLLYIAGDGRSGSTLLSRLLGGVPGWFAGGELRYVWERGLLDDRLCECGSSFSSCPFWTQVVERLDPSLTTPAAARAMVDAERRLLRTRQAGRAVRLATTPERFRSLEPAYAEGVSALYAAVHAVAGCSVLVDSSKLATYGLVLRGDPSLRVAVVHLVRDPRATAYSWQRRKPLDDDNAGRQHMRRRGPLHSSAAWASGNQLVERLLDRPGTRYYRLRYEDLLSDPEVSLKGVTSSLGWDVPLPVVVDGSVHLAPGHAVAGNPDRHHAGVVALRRDDAWRTEMPQSQQRLVRALTRPTSVRYGYGD